jgi:hypothetical protein
MNQIQSESIAVVSSLDYSIGRDAQECLVNVSNIVSSDFTVASTVASKTSTESSASAPTPRCPLTVPEPLEVE